MDAPRYFTRRYFSGRYWPPATDVPLGYISGSFAGSSVWSGRINPIGSQSPVVSDPGAYYDDKKFRERSRKRAAASLEWQRDVDEWLRKLRETERPQPKRVSIEPIPAFVSGTFRASSTFRGTLGMRHKLRVVLAVSAYKESSKRAPISKAARAYRVSSAVSSYHRTKKAA